MDRWGRKNVIMAGALGMGVSQLIVGSIYAAYKDDWASHRDAGWATAVFIWIYIACFGKLKETSSSERNFNNFCSLQSRVRYLDHP